MSTGTNKVIKNGYFSAQATAVIALLAVSCLAVIIITRILLKVEQQQFESIQATRNAERQLTDIYGPEVEVAIYNFEVARHSLGARKDPGIRAEVATGPYLEFWNRVSDDEGTGEEPMWLVAAHTSITKVLVYEYSPERFKAGACLRKDLKKVRPDGTFVEDVSLGDHCGIYVFERVEGSWKLAGYFFTSLPYSSIKRDWSQLPEWLQEILGDLPENLPQFAE
jgi:hypothetical protein